ncbi:MULTISPECIES: TerD family protein [Pseudomonas]|jgi:tellurium resistance protein TerD|uniref:Chemical-damaging agent resistance protein C n=1 Tax=Pseudomonas versuta TaxID=1788301 RepID=A0A853ZRL8_9PSED|nr:MULTISPECIES: TerD family protein [Pseudomonas]AMB81164.1 chemical-damaging agent resistance protein C [Pseudomonas fragi]MCB1653698.1 TerD family protein [Pseudomonadales bacterium]NBF16817.1 chemical-damaging agent resistance protein C [Pseudomonas sp. Fl4BN2]NNG62777.1 TerD family protein [Pseudomonas sp. GC01]AUB76928.1 chemical-damaging agent resistance protein C [Pseudomonas sp. Lz4W]
MALSLSKGGNLSLSKEAPGMTKVLVGLGWDARSTDGQDFDLDASAFLLKADGKVRADSDFIFYNQLKSTDGSVEHTGDNRTGEGDGDDEAIKIDLSKVPAEIDKIAITVTIHEADARKQNFGQVRNAFIRLVNQDNNNEVVRYDLAEDASTETAMIFAELYRNGAEWKFRAVGQGFNGGLKPLAESFGLKF